MSPLKALILEAQELQTRLNKAIEEKGVSLRLPSGDTITGIIDNGTACVPGLADVPTGTVLTYRDQRYIVTQSAPGDIVTTLHLLETPRTVEIYERIVTNRTPWGIEHVRHQRIYSNVPVTAVKTSVLGKRTLSLWVGYEVHETSLISATDGWFRVTAIEYGGAVQTLTVEPYTDVDFR